MKSRVLLRATLIVGLVAACSDSSTDPDPRGGAVATITVSPPSVALEVGAHQTFTAVAKDVAGVVVSAEVTWSSATPATASIDEDGVVTAAAVGTTEITASVGAIHSAAATVTVSAVTVAWPTTGASSTSLIEAAIRSGALTAEQGMLYKVYASFVDPRLPAQYRGPVEAQIDNPVLAQAAARLPSYSPATKAALAPFFLTLGDPNGWYAARFPQSGLRTTGQRMSAEDCTLLDALFTRRQTQHFAVHYIFNDVYGAAVADIIVPELERVWTTEVEVFGRVPVSDATIVGKGNGCDGKLDVWILPFTGQLGAGRRADPEYDAVAWTSTYDGGCDPRAAYIGLWATPVPEAKKLRAALAHEFFHVLEFTYTHTNCADNDWLWLSEATANWAIDLVYPTDNYEQDFAGPYLFEERLTSIDEPGSGLAPQTNGYRDYIFLLYLARTYGNSVIKDIWEATGSARSVEAMVSAVQSRGGIDNVWPEFALALWNNYKDGDQEFLHDQDNLTWGLREMFDRDDAGMGPGQKSDSATLNGAPRKQVQLLTTSLALPGLRRLSIQADYIKFTDISASAVVYFNPLALAPIPHYKIQALVKIGGTWQAPEDWTTLGAKAWCRDLSSERIQELVLIYSNSTGDRSGASVDPITFLARPNVGVSNVGCGKWTGTSSVVSTAPLGGSTVSGNDLVFIRERPAGAPLPDGSGQEAFTLISGGVVATSEALCTTQSATAPVTAGDGRLLIHLDNVFYGFGAPPPDREIVEGTGISLINTTSTNTCAGVTTHDDYNWEWLQIPVLGASKVSSNGRAMSGDTTITGPAGSARLQWNLTAVREP